MDFSLTDRQKTISDRMTSLSERLKDERLVERDRTKTFSRDLFGILSDAGVSQWLLPTDKGGEGYGATDLAVALETLGEHCRDTGLIFSLAAHVCACIHPLLTYGTPSQVGHWSEKIRRGGMIGAHAITEPDAGSDIQSMSASAESVDGGYVVKGTKCYITNAPIADFLVVHLRTSNENRFFNLSTFIMDARSKGIRISRSPHEKLGLRTAAMGDIEFDHVFVPSSGLLGREGTGGMVFQVSMEWERTCLFALYVGLMKRQIRLTVRRCEERTQFGQRIIDHQSVGHKISDMYARYELSRLALYKSAWYLDKGEVNSLSSSLAKISIADSAVKNSIASIELHGAYGILTGEVERQLRDSIPALIFSGASDVLKNLMIKQVRNVFSNKRKQAQ